MTDTIDNLATRVLRQPQHLLLSRLVSQKRSRRTWAAFVVMLIHVLAIYALASGLAFNAMRRFSQAISVTIVKRQPQVPPPAPAVPNLLNPIVPEVPVPAIRIRRNIARVAIHIVVSRSPAVNLPAPKASAPQPKLPQPVPAKGILSTHTAPPYPPLARRLGESGNVVLSFDVLASGSVSNVIIVKSSGSARLDSAAASWVVTNWRYRPATRDGRPYSSRSGAKIVFDLKRGAP